VGEGCGHVIIMLVLINSPKMEGRKRYREYHRSGEAKIPRTTAWRYKNKNNFCTTTTSDSGEIHVELYNCADDDDDDNHHHHHLTLDHDDNDHHHHQVCVN